MDQVRILLAMTMAHEAANRDTEVGDAIVIDPELSLSANFERTARLYPNRPALGSITWKANYAELNAAANRLAHALMRRGVCGDRVAVLMAHDSPLLAVMVALVKAGRIGLVLNPADPETRHRQLLDDAQAFAIVTDAQNQLRAAELALPGSDVLTFDPVAFEGPDENPRLAIPAGSTAYLIYTSGSTSGPKAVMRTHRHLLHNTIRQNGVMEIGPNDRLTLFASPSGGQGITTAWSALLFGAALCPFPVIQRGFNRLVEFLQRERITVYRSSASLFRQLMRTVPDHVCFPHVRVVRLSSEPATSDDFKMFQKHFSASSTFVHSLSSSETGNMALLRLSRDAVVPHGQLPIGTASQDIEIVLLDDQGLPVRPGEVGEIAIRSRFMSAGYWQNDVLTSERFSGKEDDGRQLYRTGDMGCFNPEGLLVHAGRKDARIKLRGYRIELSEIEAALSRLPAVDTAVVDTVERGANEPQLVAHVVLRPGRSTTGGAIRRALRAKLPSHMMPTTILFLDQLPFSTHGKIDREMLRGMSTSPAAAHSLDVPRTSTERLLAGIFAEVFEVREVGRNDDFFDLGGDSLVGAVIAAKVNAALGIDVDLGLFVEHPTLAELAEVLDEERRGGSGRRGPLLRVPRNRPLPLSPAQERIWTLSQSAEGSASYTVRCCLQLRGFLDVDILRKCMSFIARRHEILRTSFGNVAGQPVQIAHPPAPIELPLIDLTGAADSEQQAEDIFRRETATAFDLTKLPLLKFTLIRMREDEHRLIRFHHHILSDGWSWNIYFRELQILYEARARGEAPPLPDSEPLHYGDYAVWQRQGLDPKGSSYRAAIAWWKENLRSPPPPLELPFRRQQPLTGLDPEDGFLYGGSDVEVSQRLATLAVESRATYYMVRMAAFLAVLMGETGEPDQVFGIYMTNRNRVALQGMFGPFANLATIRIRCDERLSFRDWLSAVRRRLLETEARSEIPYEQLGPELARDGVTLPEIRVVFALQTYRPAITFAGIKLTWLKRRRATMPWGFTLAYRETDVESNCVASFDAGLYDRAGVLALMDRLARFLDKASRNPDATVRELVAASASA